MDGWMDGCRQWRAQHEARGRCIERMYAEHSPLTPQTSTLHSTPLHRTPLSTPSTAQTRSSRWLTTAVAARSLHLPACVLSPTRPVQPRVVTVRLHPPLASAFQWPVALQVNLSLPLPPASSRAMFKNTFQSGFLSILYSIGSVAVDDALPYCPD